MTERTITIEVDDDTLESWVDEYMEHAYDHGVIDDGITLSADALKLVEEQLIGAATAEIQDNALDDIYQYLNAHYKRIDALMK